MKLIFCAFAVDDQKQTGANVGKNFLANYYKNLCVALVSAKRNNQSRDVAVALVTNAPVPKEYEPLLEKEHISIYLRPFDRFCFGEK